IAAVTQGVSVANRRAASVCTTVHSTSALSPHCRRPARLPGTGPGSASKRLVHRQFVVVHGLVPPTSRYPLPRGDGADDGLSSAVDMDVFNNHLLLALAAVAIERIKKDGIGARKLVRLG